MATNMPYRERRKKADGDVDAVGDFARALFARGLVRATIAVRTSEAQIASVACGAGLTAIVVYDCVPIPRGEPLTGLWQPGTHMHVGCVSGMVGLHDPLPDDGAPDLHFATRATALSPTWK